MLRYEVDLLPGIERRDAGILWKCLCWRWHAKRVLNLYKQMDLCVILVMPRFQGRCFWSTKKRMVCGQKWHHSWMRQPNCLCCSHEIFPKTTPLGSGASSASAVQMHFLSLERERFRRWEEDRQVPYKQKVVPVATVMEAKQNQKVLAGHERRAFSSLLDRQSFSFENIWFRVYIQFCSIVNTRMAASNTVNIAVFQKYI